jgi:HD-GYP domain-containing protein (c-di-GMP phosphodiesterase class II)
MQPKFFILRISRHQAWSIAMLGMAVALLVGTMALLKAGPITLFDNALLDKFETRTGSGDTPHQTVVIDIDDVSLAALGQWPWPRYRIASLLQRVAAEKPATIALDILFPEADRTSIANIKETFKRDFDVDVAFSGVPSGLLDNDGYLGHEIAQTRTVASSYFYFDHQSQAKAPSPGVAFRGNIDQLAIPEASGALVNVAALSSQAHASGFVNSQPDSDGVLRRVPLLIRYAGVVHPSLSLAAAMQAMGVASATVESGVNGWSLKVGNHSVPIDHAGYATLRFAGGPAQYASVSAVDVLSGHLRPSDVKGKIVFIGTSVVGLNDLHHTAVDPRFPGLKIQSVVAENLLNDRFVRTPSWAPAAIFLSCVILGALLACLFAWVSSVASLLCVTVLACAAVLGASATLFSATGMFVSPAAPLVLIPLLFTLFCTARFAIEKKRAQTWRLQLENARQLTIESMASVAETRDPETGAHIKRTQHYVRAVALQLRRGGQHADILTPEFIDLLFLSAPLHDIGKVGVPDHILLKPGPHTPDEMQQMRRHAEFGRQIILSTAQRIEGDNFLLVAGDIAATHHEKWDGTGYPVGLSGSSIPLAGRIMAVADIYDALISRRCYKEPFSHGHATMLMRNMRGTTFDPTVLDAFFAIEGEVQEIAARFQDVQSVVAEVHAGNEIFDGHDMSSILS